MNTFKKVVVVASLLVVCSSSSIAQQIAADHAYQSLALEWSEVTYATPEKQHETLLEELYLRARVQLRDTPDSPELLTWAGIITASYAGAKGGLGALKLVKEARQYLETAMRIDPEALQGGARTSLGVLYAQVPPWPVSFGNSMKAEALLKESYQKHGDNLDVLFFYADFLLDSKNYSHAREVFTAAARLPEREQRPVADAGRRKQIQERLDRIETTQAQSSN